tara:strand:- start:1871 stop:2278 length:408 start_codon:yes stop_codon:yes gene_type:complete
MKRLIILSLILILYGCTQKIADFSIVSTKNIDLGDKFQSMGIISGDDTEYIIFVIPTGTIKIDDAIHNTLIMNGAEYLSDVKVENQTFYIPYIGGFTKYKITGEGWKSSTETINKFKTKENMLLRFDPESGERIP